MQTLTPEPLSADKFRRYGDVLDTTGTDAISINKGNCLRHHDLATIDVKASGVGISLFDAKAYSNPLMLDLLERHPIGSQAFFPTSDDPYLVIVADDLAGVPALPKVFITSGYQGVNYRRNIWHGVLTPIVKRTVFVVVDYIGVESNLEEYRLEVPLRIDFSSCLPGKTP